MDENMKWLKESRINTTINSLKRNGINGYLVNSNKELIDKVNELTKDGDTVSCGGSITLFETGIIDYLRSGKYNFLDRYKEGLSKDDLKKLYRNTFSADVYFTSTNAITEKGELYNVDGTGNRVAAMLYGPDKVIVIAGINKIVKDIEEAVERNERISAPANCKRLSRDTPCIKVGHCVNCSSEERICNEYTIIKRQGNKDRMHVIFLNEELGY
jgi:L-lactate utilization protein LutB